MAEQLAGTGADVVLDSRTPTRTEAAISAIRARMPEARLRALKLDLADLSSVASVVERLGQTASTRSCTTQAQGTGKRSAHRPWTATNWRSAQITSAISR
ncbi:hypothetical protein ACTWJ8_02395 [Streptomyces sp. SDT5-1]|uniref:hypothetical protein n=1 Tax=Streptomyces sp. SDT5-1 TaxID=3406418 RepID=UPI003FD35B5F